MVVRNAYKVILQYEDNNGKLNKVAMDCVFVTKDKNDDQALTEAVDIAKQYMSGEKSLASTFKTINGKRLIGAYIDKFDYGASN